MALREQITDDMKTAMKAKDEAKLSALRMIRAEILKLEKDGRGADGITDADVQKVLNAIVKQRRDSAEVYRKNGREEAALAEEADIKVAQAYLPEELGENVIREAIQAAIAASGATSAKDIGKVMGQAMGKLKATGKPFDGQRANAIAKELLGA